MIEDSLLKDSLKTCQNQPETQIYYELFKGLNICIPKEPLEQTRKEEWSSQRMGEILQCPTFFTPRRLFTQRIKRLTCHRQPSEPGSLLRRRRKGARTMRLLSPTPAQGSCNRLASLCTNTLMLGGKKPIFRPTKQSDNCQSVFCGASCDHYLNYMLPYKKTLP